jgi:hypothetical protein
MQYESSVHGDDVEVYILVGACYLVPLSGGFRRGVHEADVRHMYSFGHKFFV